MGPLANGSDALTAVVLGSSGSVGAAVVEALLRHGPPRRVLVPTRRSQPEQVALARQMGIELRELLLPSMSAESLQAATTAALLPLAGSVVGLSALGVGAGTARLSLEAHRAVDVGLNHAFARGLRATGRLKHLALMSAVGANVRARSTGSGAAGMPRYARVKGEAEQAVRDGASEVVSIFRPAMIVGSRHTPRLLAALAPVMNALTPAKYRSITVEQIAAAMVSSSYTIPATSKIYHYPEMVALATAAS